MHAASLRLMKSMLDSLSEAIKGKVLDVGSYDINGTYRDIFTQYEVEYFGADLRSGPNVDIVLHSPYNWELSSDSFDLVVCGQTLEHTEFFWETFREMVRVLKPNGYIFMVHPGSGPEHKFPVDCWRFLPDGYKALSKWAGVDLISVDMEKGTKWCDTYGVFRKKGYE